MVDPLLVGWRALPPSRQPPNTLQPPAPSTTSTKPPISSFWSRQILQNLPLEREVSSVPCANDPPKWEYLSVQRLHYALVRKGWEILGNQEILKMGFPCVTLFTPFKSAGLTFSFVLVRTTSRQVLGNLADYHRELACQCSQDGSCLQLRVGPRSLRRFLNFESAPNSIELVRCTINHHSAPPPNNSPVFRVSTVDPPSTV